MEARVTRAEAVEPLEQLGAKKPAATPSRPHRTGSPPPHSPPAPNHVRPHDVQPIHRRE